jgi:hypothetical protein
MGTPQDTEELKDLKTRQLENLVKVIIAPGVW